jgi:predicted DNA binding protein
MRRLTLQFTSEDMIQHEGEQAALNGIDTFEILHILRQDRTEMAMIARLSLKDKNLKIEDIFGDELDEYQLIEKEKGGGGVYFFRSKPRNPEEIDSILGFGGYLTMPFGINNGKVTMTFLGNSNEIKNLLKSLEQMKIPYKVVGLTDAKFSHDSPLSQLTEKQRRILLSAFNSGYYDVPRKISSEELAEKLNIKAPTLVIHRRKAELRVLGKIING